MFDWFTKADVMGAHHSMHDPRVGLSDVGLEPFTSQGGFLYLHYRSHLCVTAQMSLPLSLFSVALKRISLAVEELSCFSSGHSQGCCICSCSSDVYVRWGELRIFLIHHLPLLYLNTCLTSFPTIVPLPLLFFRHTSLFFFHFEAMLTTLWC